MEKIKFYNLPFETLQSQVIYIESAYDITVNQFIESHFRELCDAFMSIGKEFYFLPMLTCSPSIKEKVLYYAPYLSEKILYSGKLLRSDAMLRFADDTTDVLPSLLCNPQSSYADKTSTFSIAPIDKENGLSVEAFVESIRKADEEFYLELECMFALAREKYEEVRESRCCFELSHGDSTSEQPMPAESASLHRCMEKNEESSEVLACSERKASSAKSKKKKLLERFMNLMSLSADKEETDVASDSISLKGIEEEELSLEETRRILTELRANVQRLRLEGVSLMAIHEFIDKQEPLSRLVITEDYRLFLPDYNNMEIEMGALPKAIFFLFLRYPEGIVCKHMPDYYNELINIYKQLRPHTDEARMNLTITKVVNPLGNALNENIARIRKAFVSKFDEHLANNYIITGERGEEYSIPLNRDLIIWEE